MFFFFGRIKEKSLMVCFRFFQCPFMKLILPGKDPGPWTLDPLKTKHKRGKTLNSSCRRAIRLNTGGYQNFPPNNPLVVTLNWKLYLCNMKGGLDRCLGSSSENVLDSLIKYGLFVERSCSIPFVRKELQSPCIRINAFVLLFQHY